MHVGVSGLGWPVQDCRNGLDDSEEFHRLLHITYNVCTTSATARARSLLRIDGVVSDASSRGDKFVACLKYMIGGGTILKNDIG
jgi:hypothetical protein